mgnify:FL=1
MGKSSKARVLSDADAKAFSKSIRISPQKLNLVARSIRGKSATKALAQLEFSTKRISKDVKKVLESAIANAENNHQLDVDSLYVSEAFVGKSMTMKRWRPRARGRIGKILKPFSNLTIIVTERKEAA